MSKTLSFEEQLQQLEAIVSSLDRGNLTLDESIKAFENGMKITQKCQKILDKAEQTIQYFTADKL